jgi:hypothetical protein
VILTGRLVGGGRPGCSRLLTKHPRNPTEDEAGNLPGGLLVQARQDMAEGVHCDRDDGVAQRSLTTLAGTPAASAAVA